jgi:hypothetical protein
MADTLTLAAVPKPPIGLEARTVYVPVLLMVYDVVPLPTMATKLPFLKMA